MARCSRRRRGTSIHDLPDELLELVLLRVRTPICLFRAAATCKVWRRVISGDHGGFLQRVRSLHRPNHLLGHYSVKTTQTKAGRRTDIEFVPFPPARPAAHLRQRLSLDYLMDGEHAMRESLPVLTDSRGGLLAFVRGNCHAVVCDPWTRQYRVLDLPWDERDGDRCCLGAFILDAGVGDGDDMSSFSVLCVCLILDGPTTAEACVFSARENGWIRRTVSDDDICTEVAYVDMDQQFVGRAGGSIFFSGFKDDHHGHVLLVLDEATGDFSTITLPLAENDAYNHSIDDDRENLRVVNVNRPPDAASRTLVRIVRLAKEDLEVLKVTRDEHGDWDCTVERSVDLCKLANIDYSWSYRVWGFLETIDGQMAPPAPMARPMTRSFCSAQARHGPMMSAVPTTATATLQVIGAASSTLFSLDVQTMKLQRVKKKMTTATLDLNVRRVFPYELPWQPVMY